MRSDLSLPWPDKETAMSIKGLKEALARKQAQQHPDGTAKDLEQKAHALIDNYKRRKLDFDYNKLYSH
jgi:hypothetical protein